MYSSPVSQPHQLARQALPKDNSDDAVSSLRHRLKALSASDDVEKRAQDDEAQRRERDQQQLSAGSLNTLEKPKFLDITTAFFRRPTTIAKDQPQKKAATPLVHQRRGATYQHRTGRDLQTRQQQPQQPQQQRAQSPPRGFNISDSPLARDLVEAVAAESNRLFNERFTKLDEVGHSLRSIQADTTAKDDQLLGILGESARKYCKPLSDTIVLDESVDEHGAVNKKSVLVGRRVAFVKDRVQTLDAEITSLWAQWEDAQHQVDALFAELANKNQGEASNESASTTAVRVSLAREVANFEKELEDIFDDIHEEARVFEKDFSRRIQAVQHSFLQGYLL